MIKNLEHYMQRTQFITPEKADEVLTVLNTETNWHPHPFNTEHDNICVKENPQVPYNVTRLDDNHVMNKYLGTQIDRVVDSYIQDYIKDVTWFNYWNGKTRFFWIHYPEQTSMDTHCDHVRNIFDGERKGIPTLTVLGSLNDDYEGGELLFWEDTKMKLRKGEVIIFPSNFLYPHKVLEVTKGNRYSFIVWIW